VDVGEIAQEDEGDLAGYDTTAMTARAYEPCERCGRPATQWHHCLVRRNKRHPEYNAIYNLEHLCVSCHEHKGGYEERRAFYNRQANRYGVSFVEWWDSLDIPGKERY
jgi:hypothetical protein